MTGLLPSGARTVELTRRAIRMGQPYELTAVSFSSDGGRFAVARIFHILFTGIGLYYPPRST
jgi:hypothetical protein